MLVRMDESPLFNTSSSMDAPCTIIPAILLGLHSVFHIISGVYGFFSGPTHVSLRSGAFAWHAHVPEFDIERVTKRNGVPYFVNAQNLVGGNDAGWNERVEMQTLSYRCWQENEHKAQSLARAKSSFFSTVYDEDKLEDANSFRMVSCEALKEWRK